MVSPVLLQLALWLSCWLFIMLPLRGPGKRDPALGMTTPITWRSVLPSLKRSRGWRTASPCGGARDPRDASSAPPRPDPHAANDPTPPDGGYLYTFVPTPIVTIAAGSGWSNLRANGHPNGSPWRQLHCTACEGYFPEHHGTLFHGKHAEVERIVHVLYLPG